MKDVYFITGILIIAVLVVAAVGAPVFSPYEPAVIDQSGILMPPSARHIMGTDGLGRDVFSRLIYGTRISLSVGFIAVGISTIVGLIAGSLAGFYGGWVDLAVMRFVDVMLCFPSFFLILAVVAILEPSIFNIMAVIGITSWMGTARLIRAEILTLKEREFIHAARSIGASDLRIIAVHLIPNAYGPVLVNAILGMASAILLESGLSFLGLGVQPPIPSWGNILIESKSTLGIAWWITVFPGALILITILAFNFIAEGIRRKVEG